MERAVGPAGGGRPQVGRRAVVADRGGGHAGRGQGPLHAPGGDAQTQVGVQVADQVHPERLAVRRRPPGRDGAGRLAQHGERGEPLRQAVAPQPAPEPGPVTPAGVGERGAEVGPGLQDQVGQLRGAGAVARAGAAQQVEEGGDLSRHERVGGQAVAVPVRQERAVPRTHLVRDGQAGHGLVPVGPSSVPASASDHPAARRRSAWSWHSRRNAGESLTKRVGRSPASANHHGRSGRKAPKSTRARGRPADPAVAAAVTAPRSAPAVARSTSPAVEGASRTAGSASRTVPAGSCHHGSTGPRGAGSPSASHTRALHHADRAARSPGTTTRPGNAPPHGRPEPSAWAARATADPAPAPGATASTRPPSGPRAVKVSSSTRTGPPVSVVAASSAHGIAAHPARRAPKARCRSAHRAPSKSSPWGTTTPSGAGAWSRASHQRARTSASGWTARTDPAVLSNHARRRDVVTTRMRITIIVVAIGTYTQHRNVREAARWVWSTRHAPRWGRSGRCRP